MAVFLYGRHDVSCDDYIDACLSLVRPLKRLAVTFPAVTVIIQSSKLVCQTVRLIRDRVHGV